MFLKYSLRFTTFTSFISLINQLLPLPRILFSVLRLDILHRIAVRAVEFHGLRVEDFPEVPASFFPVPPGAPDELFPVDDVPDVFPVPDALPL